MNCQLSRWVVVCGACLSLTIACGDDDDSGNTADSGAPDGGADGGAGSGGSTSMHGNDGGGSGGTNANQGDVATGESCKDDADCKSEHCVGGTCCKSACDAPPACMTAKGASCDDGSHCEYAKAANGTDCDDGDACTSGESCKNGECSGGKSKTCKPADDCHTASCDPDSGDCVSKELKDGTACDDGLSCTVNEACKDGVCKDSDGKSACLEGATACSEDNDRTCTCDALYLRDDTSHTCQPDLCAMDPCGAHATCTTPGGVRTCTCDDGWNGDPGSAVGCACPTGQLYVNGQCVCDLSGAFALRIKSMETWAASPGFKASGGPVPVYTWAIRKQVYSSDGTLQTTQIPCGGSAPVLCGDMFFPNQAWGGFDDYRQWGTMNDPGAFQTSSSTASIPNALASQPFETPLEAILSGIHMAHPLTDAWPASASAVGAAYSAANPNKPYWVDDDQDGQPGVASYFIPPDTLNPDTLPHTGGARAAVAATGIGPDNTCGASYDWAYPPGQCSASTSCTKVKAAFQGTRAILQYSGTINSCDDITGTVYGPPSPLGCNTAASGGNCDCGGMGQARCGFLSSGRVAGCWQGTDASETLCGDPSSTSSPAHWLDVGNGEAPASTDTTFHIKRVPANMFTNGDVTCETVRALLPRD